MARRRRSIDTALKVEVPAGAGILVAFSGGRDSAVLLDGLMRLRRLLKVRIEACHIDHGLRSSSKNDAEFVGRFCLERGVECHVRRLGPKPARTNMEGWARQQRYLVFREVLAERKLDWVVTAHTANDVAETLLIRLLANKELNSIEARDGRRRLLRPLLSISRDQINQYVQRYGIEYIEDPTNSDTALVRNRVRLKLLPGLAKDFDPSIVWSLAERAQALAEDCDALEEVALGVVSALGALQFGDPAWLGRCEEQLASLPSGVRWRVVQALLLPVLGFDAGEKSSKAVVQLLGGDLSKVQLRADLTLTRDRFGLALRTQKA